MWRQPRLLCLVVTAVLFPTVHGNGQASGYYYKLYTAADLEGKLLYAHMSKTGGTQIHQVLRLSVLPDKRAFHAEPYGLNDAHRAAFVIGSIRNPCEYYVSLWAFQSTSVGLKVGMMADMKRREPESWERLVGKNEGKSFGTEDDIKRFRAWLRYVSKTNYGYYSARFYRKYVEKIAIGASSIDMKSNAYLARNLSEAEVEDQLSQLRDANVTGLASCWVKTENLADDLLTCLERFERAHGPGAVHREGAEKVLSSSEKSGKRVNKSPHKPCKRYYDPESAALVKSMDKHLFEKFGYQTCCKDAAPAAHPNEL